MELAQQLITASLKVRSWLPRRISLAVAFPTYQVREAAVVAQARCEERLRLKLLLCFLRFLLVLRLKLLVVFFFLI